MKTCCGNGTLQKVSRGVLATARQFGLYYGVREDGCSRSMVWASSGIVLGISAPVLTSASPGPSDYGWAGRI